MYTVIGADQKQYGPVSAGELRDWIAQRRLNAQSLIRAEGAAEWKALSACPEFAGDLAAHQGPPTAMAPAPAGYDLGGARRTNPMAIAGLIMGIITITFGLCCCYGFPFNVLGIIFSCLALSQIGKDPAREGGKGLALAGLILCILGTILALGLLLLGIAMNGEDILREIQRSF